VRRPKGAELFADPGWPEFAPERYGKWDSIWRGENRETDRGALRIELGPNGESELPQAFLGDTGMFLHAVSSNRMTPDRSTVF
jgi:hypothetical protein